MKSGISTRASVGATIIFAIVAGITMLSGPSPASAQTPTMVLLVSMSILGIELHWSGNEAINDLHMTLDPLTIFFGTISAALLLAHIDSVTASSITLLLIQVSLHNSGGCIVNFHGPLIFTGTGTLSGTYDKLELGGILYSVECGDPGDPDSTAHLVLLTLADDGIHVLFVTL
jgi:hypothetical protein